MRLLKTTAITATLLALLGVSACSLFHKKRPPPPEPPEFIVTGAPTGSIVYIDDVQRGDATAVGNLPQELKVTVGMHQVEVRMGDTVSYREQAYVEAGEKRVITVLSGFNRE